ncbi:MAG: extracellular solute-binding protein [Deltaproteobacteria bacterium]|nr:extracellular solute-binding protein [Deltaproteobacteria bacterium]
MKRLNFFVASLVALAAIAAAARHGPAAPVDELVAAAKKEGTIDFYAASTLTPKGAQELGEAFNRKYGLNIKLYYHPSGNMARDVGQVVSLAAAGAPPEWDLMVVTDAHHATLWLRKRHQPFDYSRLGVDQKSIQYDNGTVALAHGFILPAYNKKVLPPKDVPKSWEDLVDPKWRGGKLGMTTAVHQLARLATAWGEEKTTRYVKALAAQQPVLGQPAEISTRLQLGEILAVITLAEGFIHRAKVTGAPVVHAEIDPVIAHASNAGVLKGARHPNVGHLFTAFLTTLEAQEIWEKYRGEASAFVPGTTAYRYAQGKRVLYMAQDQAEMVDRLTREYGKILGFGK